MDVDIVEEWRISLLSRPPRLARHLMSPNVYCTAASEAGRLPDLEASTYNFQGATLWWAAGLQILHASERRPDCVQKDHLYIEKLHPPTDRADTIIIGNFVIPTKIQVMSLNMLPRAAYRSRCASSFR